MKIRRWPFNICIIQVYAPAADSSEEDVEYFYNKLDQGETDCKSQDI